MPELVGWSGRVAFSDAAGIAYAPGEVFVPGGRSAEAFELLQTRQGSTEVAPGEDRGSLVRFRQVVGPLDAIDALRVAGIPAQPNHVLFSHSMAFAANPFAANPFAANPFAANPFAANPFAANPFSANPFAANPFAANPFAANPFAANPFAANPFVWKLDADAGFHPSPLYLLALAGLRPETAEFRATGLRSHSAHPAKAPVLPQRPSLPAGVAAAPTSPSILVIDTGLASAAFSPDALAGVAGFSSGGRSPDEVPDADSDSVIDPVAGHGTFIAGIIERIAPGHLRSVPPTSPGGSGASGGVNGLLNPEGDATEDDVALVLESLLADPPSLLNLSFGGYALTDMPCLGEAVRNLQDVGTVIVASAGNDATWRPQYPAAFPGVVSVGALGPHGPAPFTNYGPWVRACAPGVDIVSTFFKDWAPAAADGDSFDGWARWSGTSFAAPAVVGALARAMQDGLTGEQAVDRLIDNPDLLRISGLGTVVNQGQHFQPAAGS